MAALQSARALPHGPDRTAATEAVVAEIEASDQRLLLPLAYHSLIWAYSRGAELRKAFVPFVRARRLYDTEPNLFDDGDVHRLLWSYKWIVAGLWSMPEIPRDEIEHMIDDMELQYTVAGLGMSAVLDARLYHAVHRGDWDAAEEYYAASVAAPRDELSDCAACTAKERGGYLALRGRDADALSWLDRAAGGEWTCEIEPHGSLGTALLPYVRTGRLDAARAAHLTGYRIVRGRREFQAILADHVQFLARTGNEERAVAVVAEHADLLRGHDDPLAGLTFLASAGLALGRVPAEAVVGDTAAGELAAWCRGEALALAAAFDARNGTGWQTERALAILDAAPLVPLLRLGLGPVRAKAADALPVGVAAELIGAEGLALKALVTRAEELGVIGHPAAGALWRRVDELAGPACAPRIRAAIDDGLGRDLASTDPFTSRTLLLGVVDRWSTLGDPRKLAVARSRAAVAAALAGEHDEAVAESSDAGTELARHGTAMERLHHRHRCAYIRLATAADDAGRAEASRLFHDHAAYADALGAVADMTQSRIILLDRLNEPSDVDEVAQAWAECGVAAREVGREWWLPHIAVRLAQARLAAGWFPDRFDDVLAPLAAAVRSGDEWGEPRTAAYARYLTGELLAEAERYADALDPAFDAVVRAEDAGVESLVTDARALLGSVYHELDRDHEAVEFLESALPELSEHDHGALYRVRYRLGVSLRRLGEHREAAEHLNVASEIAERAGIAASAAHAANLVGVALEPVDPATSATAYERAARLFAAADEEQGAIRMQRARAAVLAESGRYDDALAALELAAQAADVLTPSDGVDPGWERAEIDDQSARVLAVAGRAIEAVHRALSAEQRHQEVGAASDAAYAATLAAQVTLDLLEDAEAAEPVARRALAHADISGDDQARSAAVSALADVLDGQGRVDEAAQLRGS